MDKPRLAKVEKVSIRDHFKHEERDFTPWLANNLGTLARQSALSLRLSLKRKALVHSAQIYSAES
jgi:hypothetical protein